MNRITFPMLMLGLSLTTVLCGAAEPQQPRFDGRVASAITSTPSSGDDAAQLKAAQDERVKVLTQLVEAGNEELKLGVARIDQVVAAENELSNAVLTSTDKPDTKIALLTKQLERATKLFKGTQALHDVGAKGGTESDLLWAKSLYHLPFM